MEWKTVKLGDYIQDIAAGPFGSNLKVECFVPDGFPIIDGANLRGYTVTDNVTKFVTEEKARSLYRSIAKRGEVVVTISGNVGQIAYIPNDSKYEEYLVSQRQFRVRFKDSVNVPYLVYYFHSREGQHQILSFANQTGVPALAQPLKNFRNIELPLPPLETQRRIAAILSSLDDKIENNNRINRNLEAQAQALFKSWFVDFEPWGGTMPEDWREGTLGEIAEFKRGKGILGKDARPGNVPVVAGGMEPAYCHDTANTKAPVITISASGANAGYVRLYNEDIWASDCSWIDASSKNLLWVYCYLSINRHILRHAQTGAVQPHVKAKDVNAFEIIVPAQKVIEDFIEVVKPLFDQIANNQKESHRLAALRDTLLPKLMRGEITL